MSNPSKDVSTGELEDGQLDAVVGGSTALRIATNSVVGTSLKQDFGDRMRDGLDGLAKAPQPAPQPSPPVGSEVMGDNLPLPGHTLA